MSNEPSNSQRSWQAKIDTLSRTKGAKAKRERALGQMNMTGNEWVRAQVDLGMLPAASLDKLNRTPLRLDNPLGAV